MSTMTLNPLLRWRQSPMRWRMQGRLERARLAWALLTCTMTADQARGLTCDLEAISGNYALESLDEPSVLELARNLWGEVEELPELVGDACARVALKWDSNSDTVSSAEAWAMEMVEEYAQQRGVILTESEG